ncbi:MAG: hypothetical protein HUK40_05545 [Desulfobacter sp.]|nr:hypothetical protein [Desulfobacter sp.]
MTQNSEHSSNIREMVCPYIDKLSEEGLHSRHQTLIDIINHHIDDIMSPLLKKLSSRYYKLTPQELRVASLVRSGNTSKEISHILCISTNAVNFHRKNIRIKLGLTREKINLQTHLLTMDK